MIDYEDYIRRRLSPLINERAEYDVIITTIATALKRFRDSWLKTIDGLRLDNRKYNMLDDKGHERGVIRNTLVNESDDAYRERIRYYWKFNITSQSIELVLNKQFGKIYGEFKVCSIPNVNNVIDVNATTDRALLVDYERFPTELRPYNQGIIIVVQGRKASNNEPMNINVWESEILPVVNSYIPLGRVIDGHWLYE